MISDETLSQPRADKKSQVYKEVNERVTPRGKAELIAGSKGEGATVFKPHGLCKKVRELTEVSLGFILKAWCDRPSLSRLRSQTTILSPTLLWTT